jgi:serine/threonine protein kinase
MSTCDVFGLAGAVIENRIAVQQVIAEGGFGVVYRAVQIALDRVVALKVLKTPPNLTVAERVKFLEGFSMEARTMAQFKHPSIVEVYDFGVSPMPRGDRAAWMALEWLEGQTLDQFLVERRGKQHTCQESLALLTPVFQGLAMAHRRGIAHRDIKPSNMMFVHAEGTEPSLKVLDFGISKRMTADEDAGTGATRTKSQLIAFSPSYGAPEQLGGLRTGPWTDVHAMALIVTELLCGRPPYCAEELHLFVEIMDRQRPTPAKFGIDVGAWEWTLSKALAMSPKERFADAGAFFDALTATLPNAFTRMMPNAQPMAPYPADTRAGPSTNVKRRAHSTQGAVSSAPQLGIPRSRAPLLVAFFTPVIVLGALGAWVTLRNRALEPARSAASTSSASTVARLPEASVTLAPVLKDTPLPSATPRVTLSSTVAAARVPTPQAHQPQPRPAPAPARPPTPSPTPVPVPPPARTVIIQ